MNRLFQFLIVAAAVLLSACASVQSTAVFYQPMSSTIYPPKDKHAVIPIMSGRPSRPYTEIGRFAFQSDMGFPFMMKAIEYNARRAGADAVYIKDSKSWIMPVWYSVPPSVTWIPVGGWYGGGCGGWNGPAMIPVTYPGYSGISYENFMGMDARMIVFKQ